MKTCCYILHLTRIVVNKNLQNENAQIAKFVHYQQSSQVLIKQNEEFIKAQ